jgi:hypothetical protein
MSLLEECFLYVMPLLGFELQGSSIGFLHIKRFGAVFVAVR